MSDDTNPTHDLAHEACWACRRAIQDRDWRIVRLNKQLHALALQLQKALAEGPRHD